MRVSNNYFRGTRIAINKGSYYDITFKDDKLVFTDVFEMVFSSHLRKNQRVKTF